MKMKNYFTKESVEVFLSYEVKKGMIEFKKRRRENHDPHQQERNVLLGRQKDMKEILVLILMMIINEYQPHDQE